MVVMIFMPMTNLPGITSPIEAFDRVVARSTKGKIKYDVLTFQNPPFTSSEYPRPQGHGSWDGAGCLPDVPVCVAGRYTMVHMSQPHSLHPQKRQTAGETTNPSSFQSLLLVTTPFSPPSTQTFSDRGHQLLHSRADQ